MAEEEPHIKWHLPVARHSWEAKSCELASRVLERGNGHWWSTSVAQRRLLISLWLQFLLASVGFTTAMSLP